MSFISQLFTNVQGTIENVASAIPVVGGAVASAVGAIHTGDETQINGIWYNNVTGLPVSGPPTGTLAQAVANANQVNQNVINSARDAAAKAAAEAGIGVAGAIGSPGNWYQFVVDHPSFPLLIGLVVLVLVFLLARRSK